MLKIIGKLRSEFMAATNRNPVRIHMTKIEMKNLSNDLRDCIFYSRDRDLKESLYPHLLPPMREIPDVTAGCFIYGMEIVETDDSGLHLST